MGTKPACPVMLAAIEIPSDPAASLAKALDRYAGVPAGTAMAL